jgi:hypothetical protein
MCTGGEEVELEVYHSPPSSAEVRNEWSYPSSPSVYLHSMETDYFVFVPFTRFNFTAKFDCL